MNPLHRYLKPNSFVCGLEEIGDRRNRGQHIQYLLDAADFLVTASRAVQLAALDAGAEAGMTMELGGVTTLPRHGRAAGPTI